MNEVTRLLKTIDARAPPAAEQLLPLVDDERRRLAVNRWAGEKPGQTLQATALVHDCGIDRRLTNEHGQVIREILA
jgi:hypothetical protein